MERGFSNDQTFSAPGYFLSSYKKLLNFKKKNLFGIPNVSEAILSQISKKDMIHKKMFNGSD